MQTTRLEIGDGINFCAVRTDKFKHSALTLSFTSKLTSENAALSSLLVAVLTRSCKKFPEMKMLNRELDRLYSASIDCVSTKYGEVHASSIQVSAMENAYVPEGEDLTKQVAELAVSLFLEPDLEDGVFKADIVESEKKNLIDAIKASSNNKDAYALRRCAEIMCESERFSTYKYGSVEDVEAITPESLTQWYNHVVNSAKIDVYFVGNYDEYALCDMMRELFAHTKRNYGLEQPSTKVRRKAGELKEVIETEPVSQAKLVLGFRMGRSLADRNYAAMTLVREILGASPVSKLHVNVREKLSLCYYCYAALEHIKGLMFIPAGIDAANFQAAKTEILAQLSAMVEGKISDEEFNSAKDSLINKYKEIEDSPFAIIEWYLARGIIGIVDSPDLASLAIKYLTKEQVIKASEEIFLETVYLMKGEEDK